MKVSLKDRVLAQFDRLFGSSGWSSNGGGGRLVDFKVGLGRKMLTLDQDNRVMFLGRSMWVRHEYDSDGNFVRRIVVRKNLEPGGRVIYGYRKVYRAYDLYGVRYSPSGGFIE
jgi:hypothetical protein